MNDEVIRLSGSRNASAAIEAAEWQQPIRVEAEPDATGGLRFIDQAGRLLGTITARHQVACRVAGGEIILHCAVSSKRNS